MNVYLILAIVAGVVIVATLAAYYGFFRAGSSSGAANATADVAKADLDAVKKADAVVTKEISRDDLDKNLRDGSF